jgi:hypothetical protein
VNKTRTSVSPETKVVSIGRLPAERQEALDAALDGLVFYTGANDHSFPKGSVLEALVVLGGQHREELKTWFQR